jgi:carbamoyl-phosphate synthase large subunit
VFVSIANRDKRHAILPIKVLADIGMRIMATAGTAQVLRRHGIDVTTIRKSYQGIGPNGEPTVVEALMNGEIDLVINTPHGHSQDGSPRRDGWQIRSAAILANVPCVTNVQGLAACVEGIDALQRQQAGVRSLQSWNAAMGEELAALI